MSDPPENFNPDETWISEGTEVPGSNFHESPTAPLAPGRTASPEASFETAAAFDDLREGVQVPGYKIIRQIGKGGMGAVFLAEQDRPRRTVALKVIRADRVSEAARRRFEFEAEILARLQHPGIAQIYEVGTFNFDNEVTPYFVMEYIAGAQPLTSYANSKKLNIQERLALFAKVCDAVRHGHQKGVIHRDLKPANILVDDTGEPRVIDFGVARAQDSEAVLATMQTNAGQLVGTLQYMSPEQCSGSPDNIDVRTDVYALGVVLFQLLSGELPYDLSTLGLAEAVFVVTQDRAPSLATIEARFKGDLAVITAKAMAKEKDDRYQSASELAADIRRYLEDRPILARPIGPVGLLYRWMKRNKQLSTAIVSAAAILTITSAVLIARIVVAEQRATEGLANAKDVIGRTNVMLQFRDKDGRTIVQEGRVDVKQLLDGAAEHIDSSPPDNLSTEADFRELLGVGYVSLRSLPEARKELERVLEIRKNERPVNKPELAAAYHNLARVDYWDRDYQTAHDHYDLAVNLRRQVNESDDADLASSLNGLAAAKQRLGDLTRAEELFRESLTMRERLYGQQHPEIAASHNNLGNLYVSQQRFDEAEKSLKNSLAMISELYKPKPDDEDQAEAIETSFAAHNLAACLMRLEKFQEAEEYFDRALTIRTSRRAAGDILIAISQLGLARARLELGNNPSAEHLARDALQSMLAVNRPSSHPDVTSAQETLARALEGQSETGAAIEAIESSIEGTRAASPVLIDTLAERLTFLGQCLIKTNQTGQAETALAEAVELLVGEDDPHLLNRAGQLLVDLYTRSGRETDASRIASIINDQ